MAGAGRPAAGGLERGRRSGARGRAHAGGGRAVRDAARRRGQRDHRLRVGAGDRSRRARRHRRARAGTALREQKRWADLARLLERRALQSPPAEAFALRRRRAEILADELDSLDEAAEELELLSADNPRRSPIAACSTCWSASTSAPNATTTTCARCSGRPTRSPTPAERLALLRRLAAEGEARPDGPDRARRGAGADPAHRAARRRSVRRAGTHLPRRGSAGGPGRGDGAPARGHATPSRRSASCCPRWPRSTNASSTSGSRRSTPTGAPRSRATRGPRPTPRSIGWPSGSGAGTWPPRRRASGPRSRPRTRARWRRSRACGATTASSKPRWACSSTPPSARRPARRRRRC